MHLLPLSPRRHPPIFVRIIGAMGLYTLIVVLLGLFAPTDYPHPSGDWHRDLRKVFIAAAATWLICRWSWRSLDRTRSV